MNKHIRIVIFFAVLTIAFFAPVLFTNHNNLPIGSDFVNFNYPNDLFANRTFKQSEIPLWNPYVSTGQPYAADPNIGAFYPLRLIFTLTSFNYKIMTYMVIMHYFLAGLFTYALARDLGTTKWGGIIAGIGFMFSGFLIGQMDHINIVMSSIWLPLVFLFFRRAILTRKSRYALIAGLFLSLSVLGGHQQFSLFIGYWCGLWFLIYLIHQRGKNFIRSISQFTLMAIVALAAAAIQVIPTIEFFQFTERSLFTVYEASAHSMPPMGWLLLLLPHYWGQNYVQAFPFWDIYVNVNESYVYAGIIVIFFALIGSYVWKSWEKWFLIVITIIAFFLTAGSVTPLFHLAFNLVPGMQWVRVPGRFVFWVSMSLPLLAAFGADWMWNHLKEIKHKLWQDIFKLLGLGALTGAVFRIIYPLFSSLQIPATHPFASIITQYRLEDILVFTFLMVGMFIVLLLPRYWPRTTNLVPILLVSLLVIDLFRAQQPRHFTNEDVLSKFEQPEFLGVWANDTDFYRVDYTHETVDNLEAELRQVSLWNPLTGLVYGFPQTSGLLWNPFDLKHFKEYRQAITYDSPFYDFMGTKYLVAKKEQAIPGNWNQKIIDSSPLALYENSQAMPHAFMVFESLIEPDPKRALSMISQASFNPAKTVLLAKGPPFAGLNGSSQIQITKFNANSLMIQARNEQPGYLVVSDTFYPGWHVFVNGQEREILQANYAFRAVFLEAGDSSVRFEFRPNSFVQGITLTVFTWLVCCAVIIVSIRRSIISRRK